MGGHSKGIPVFPWGCPALRTEEGSLKCCGMLKRSNFESLLQVNYLKCLTFILKFKKETTSLLLGASFFDDIKNSSL